MTWNVMLKFRKILNKLFYQKTANRQNDKSDLLSIASFLIEYITLYIIYYSLFLLNICEGSISVSQAELNIILYHKIIYSLYIHYIRLIYLLRILKKRWHDKIYSNYTS